MQRYLIKNIRMVNEGRIHEVDVLVEGERIGRIDSNISTPRKVLEIRGEGKLLFPGLIDDQVHFREPGLTHKANIHTEAKAAVAGGVTSFMEMPNTIPPAFTRELLEQKYQIAARSSLANYSFYMGCSNENAEEVLRTNARKNEVCGVKIFMGSSTGNLLVDNPHTLQRIFGGSELLIATHCEDERLIRQNLERLRTEERELRAADHPLIRDENACYQSSLYAIQLARNQGTRLHILHISTAKELQLFGNMIPLKEKKITSEVCVHHLHFSSEDYDRLGNRIKCNPAIKAPQNREALWEALLDDRLDVVATDHAPHTSEEKDQQYEKAPAGLPLVQHALLLLLHYHRLGRISLEKIAQKTAHAVADCFRIRERGYVREGYHADLVIVDPDRATRVSGDNIYYKCGWSPLEDMEFPASVTHTFVNGNLVFADGEFEESEKGQRLQFDRS